MEITSQNKVCLQIEGEKGTYQFCIPLNSHLEEALKVCSHFTSSISKAYNEYLAKEGPEKEDKKENGAHES